MSIFDKLNIRTETEGTWRHGFEATHDTTLDFGQLGILKTKYLTAGHGEIRPWTYSNMEPMPQPTWGEVTYDQRIFCVPIPLIFKGYHDYKEDLIHVNSNDSWSSIAQLPYCTNADMVTAINGIANEVTATDPYDYTCLVGGTVKYFEHTNSSLRMLKILESCGYKIRWNDAYTKQFNILRILAIAKIYVDYYWNKNYMGDLQSNALKAYFKRDNGQLHYSASELSNILIACKTVFYDGNYFTDAWENPNTPNIANQKSNFTIKDPNSYVINTINDNTQVTTKPQVLNNGNKDPMLGTEASTPAAPDGRVGGPITQYALDALRGLTMFLKRNQLAGGSIAERLLARYGEIPTAVKMEKARPIGELKWTMNVDPIFSTADTASAGGEQLAQYAGYGWAISGKKFEKTFKFECEEDSILVEILTIKPKERYCQGIDGENMALTKLDLPTPAFDAMGVEMITQDELLVGNSYAETANADTLMGSTGFGFTPRYSKFKAMKDTLSGNFTNPNWAAEYLPYTLQRYMDPMTYNHTNLMHSMAYTAIADGAQYDRIFYAKQTKKPYDNFRIHHELQIEWYTWMKPLYQVYDWEHEGGKEITVDKSK